MAGVIVFKYSWESAILPGALENNSFFKIWRGKQKECIMGESKIEYIPRPSLPVRHSVNWKMNVLGAKKEEEMDSEIDLNTKAGSESARL